MATREIPNIFDCAVCFSQMVEKTPRSLSCLHTFCEDCLEPLINKNQIVCPSCRKITNVEESDVKHLPVNFFLSEIREFVLSKDSSSENSDETSENDICDRCENKTAKHKCADCMKLICPTCKKGHSNIKLYENHLVWDLCLDHNEVVRKWCNKCQIPLCESCTCGHGQEDFDDYNKILKNFEENIKSIKQSIGKAEKVYDENFDQVLDKNKRNTDILRKLEVSKRYHAKRLEKAEKLVKVAKAGVVTEVFDQLVSEYEKNRFECEDLKFGIESLCKDRLKIKNFPALQQKAEETLKGLDRNMNDDYGLLSLIEQPSMYDFVSHLTNKGLVRTLSNPYVYGNRYQKQISSIENDILIVTGSTSAHVIRVDEKGKTLFHYYPVKGGNFNVTADDEHIYIIHPDAISVMSKDQEKPIKVHEPSLTAMETICVLRLNKFLISESKRSGGIYLFDVDTNSAEAVITGLNSPTHIISANNGSGTRYIVSKTGAHCVKVYSCIWTLLHTLGTCGTSGSTNETFFCPRGIAVTDQNTIVIADENNHRVCHFTLEGKFLSIIVGNDDGVCYPVGVLCLNNLLWISTYCSGDVKCYKVEYDKDKILYYEKPTP